jgi:CRP-like cAMP-binding protein
MSWKGRADSALGGGLSLVAHMSALCTHRRSPLTLPRRCAGSYFGERALIKDEPRAATVTATAPSRCLAMDRAAFLRLLGPITDLLARNMEVYTKYTAGMFSPKPSSN